MNEANRALYCSYGDSEAQINFRHINVDYILQLSQDLNMYLEERDMRFEKWMRAKIALQNNPKGLK